MQSLNVAPIFIFLKRYPTGWHLAKKKKNTKKRGKKIHPLISPCASLYVSLLPLSIAPVDPCSLSFSSVFTPTCSHSLIPPSFLFHLPSVREAAAGQSLGRRGKVGSKEGGLNNYHASLCVRTKV